MMARSLSCLIASLFIFVAGCSTANNPSTSRRTFGEGIDDTVIVSRIKAKLVKDPIVHALRIHIDSFKGDVVLRGQVFQKYEAQRAIKLARQVRGVKSVKSELALTPIH